jgi:DNA-binding NtrC family response regulator
VGGVQEWPIRARVVAATNRDPLQALSEGRLRHDLFYRLCVHRIDVPTLSQHASDVPLLLRHMLQQLAETGHAVPLGFSPRCLELLCCYAWPGNVRELRNLVEHCAAFAVNRWVEPEDLPQHLLTATPSTGHPNAEDEDDDELMPLQDVERDHIQRALRKTGGNKARAARLLGLSRHQLYLKLERLGISDP